MIVVVVVVVIIITIIIIIIIIIIITTTTTTTTIIIIIIIIIIVTIIILLLLLIIIIIITAGSNSGDCQTAKLTQAAAHERLKYEPLLLLCGQGNTATGSIDASVIDCHTRRRFCSALVIKNKPVQIIPSGVCVCFQLCFLLSQCGTVRLAVISSWGVGGGGSALKNI